MTTPGDRRPIAAREWAPVRQIAAWLIRRQASPNQISLAGMAAAILAGALFAYAPASPAALLCGAILIQLRLFANMMDGMVAVGRGIASPLGELYNEVPDRVSDTAVLLGLGWAAGNPALGMAAALAALATAYIRSLGRAAGAPSDFRGPMAKQQRMALATAAAIFCAVTPLAWTDPALTATLWIITALALLTAVRRLLGVAAALRR